MINACLIIEKGAPPYTTTVSFINGLMEWSCRIWWMESWQNNWQRFEIAGVQGETLGLKIWRWTCNGIATIPWLQVSKGRNRKYRSMIGNTGHNQCLAQFRVTGLMDNPDPINFCCVLTVLYSEIRYWINRQNVVVHDRHPTDHSTTTPINSPHHPHSGKKTPPILCHIPENTHI